MNVTISAIISKGIDLKHVTSKAWGRLEMSKQITQNKVGRGKGN